MRRRHVQSCRILPLVGEEGKHTASPTRYQHHQPTNK
nr:MAG TPA: hypothetical protein [Caudoviricetes sp.]